MNEPILGTTDKKQQPDRKISGQVAWKYIQNCPNLKYLLNVCFLLG